MQFNPVFIKKRYYLCAKTNAGTANLAFFSLDRQLLHKVKPSDKDKQKACNSSELMLPMLELLDSCCIAY